MKNTTQISKDLNNLYYGRDEFAPFEIRLLVLLIGIGIICVCLYFIGCFNSTSILLVIGILSAGFILERIFPFSQLRYGKERWKRIEKSLFEIRFFIPNLKPEYRENHPNLYWEQKLNSALETLVTEQYKIKNKDKAIVLDKISQIDQTYDPERIFCILKIYGDLIAL